MIILIVQICMTWIFHWFFLCERWIDFLSGFVIPFVFTLPPRDGTLQYKRCVHLWNNFPCITTLGSNVIINHATFYIWTMGREGSGLHVTFLGSHGKKSMRIWQLRLKTLKCIWSELKKNPETVKVRPSLENWCNISKMK